MRHPRDIAASDIHRCLYVMEVGQSPEVLICIDAATGDVRAQCSMTDGAEGCNLAVEQRTGNVILMCTKEFVEYDHTGQKIRAIPLPAEGMDMCWQAVPCGDKQFVICEVRSVLVLISILSGIEVGSHYQLML